MSVKQAGRHRSAPTCGSRSLRSSGWSWKLPFPCWFYFPRVSDTTLAKKAVRIASWRVVLQSMSIFWPGTRVKCHFQLSSALAHEDCT